MTGQMTDPMNAFLSFQQAFSGGHIAPNKGDIHPDLLVLVDHPNGMTRFTYALIKNNQVVSAAFFIPSAPVNGNPCLNSGYAVDIAERSKGYGKEVTQKAFDELSKGFKRAGMPHLYVEAIVSIENEHSKKLANRLFSTKPETCTDGVSGLPALHYLKQLF